VFEETLGRLFIVVICVAGTLPIYSNPDELDATTVSGTMVPGLGPPIYCLAILFYFFPNSFNRFTSLVSWLSRAHAHTHDELRRRSTGPKAPRRLHGAIPLWRCARHRVPARNTRRELLLLQGMRPRRPRGLVSLVLAATRPGASLRSRCRLKQHDRAVLELRHLLQLHCHRWMLERNAAD
jgi:hypothetical protein